MDIIDTTIPDLKILQPKVFGDDRGFFMETYRQSDMDALTGGRAFVQDNHSKSKQGILRGLHYQLIKPQGKLVRVVSGEIYDVAVDLRVGSKTFGLYYGAVLSAENKRMFWIPEGFAHGFYVLSDSAECVYKCTDYYYPEYEHSLLWSDPQLDIDWPLVDDKQPLLSDKDQQANTLENVPVYRPI